MRKQFMTDIERRLLCQDKIDEEEFYAIYNGLVISYKKSQAIKNGKKYMAEEDNNKLIEEVMKTLPKFAEYFENGDHNESVRLYKESLPKQLEIEGEDYIKTIEDCMEKVIKEKAGTMQYSRNSGMNIDNDKTNYTNSIVDFETMIEKLSPEVVETLARNRGLDEEAVKVYKAKTNAICRELAQNAIDDKLEYYKRMTDYLVGFYADNEIARRSEEEAELQV